MGMLRSYKQFLVLARRPYLIPVRCCGETRRTIAYLSELQQTREVPRSLSIAPA